MTTAVAARTVQWLFKIVNYHCSEFDGITTSFFCPSCSTCNVIWQVSNHRVCSRISRIPEYCFGAKAGQMTRYPRASVDRILVPLPVCVSSWITSPSPRSHFRCLSSPPFSSSWISPPVSRAIQSASTSASYCSHWYDEEKSMKRNGEKHPSSVPFMQLTMMTWSPDKLSGH